MSKNCFTIFADPKLREPILKRIQHISKSEIVKSSGVILFFKVGTVLFNYLFFFSISKIFGAAEVGYFALSFTVIQLFAIVARSGLDIGMFKELSAGESTVRKIRFLQSRSVIYIVGLSFLILLIVQSVKNLYGPMVFASRTTGEYLGLFLLSLPFYAIMFFNGEIHRARKKFALYAVFQNFGLYFILSVFLLVRLFLWKWTFEDLIWIFVGLLIVLSLASFVGTFQKHHESEQEDEYKFFQLLKESIPIGLSSLGFFLMSWLDGVVLAQYYPEDIVGQYAIAYRIALLGSFALISINSAIGPRITELYASGEKQKLIREIRKTTKMGFWVTFPLALITFIFPETILGLFGYEFREAYIPMLIILIGQIVNTILGPSGIVLQLCGYQKIFKNIVLISALLNIALNYLVIPEYGIMGAALVNSASIIVWKIWSTMAARKIFGVTFFYIPFIRK